MTAVGEMRAGARRGPNRSCLSWSCSFVSCPECYASSVWELQWSLFIRLETGLGFRLGPHKGAPDGGKYQCHDVIELALPRSLPELLCSGVGGEGFGGKPGILGILFGGPPQTLCPATSSEAE